MSSDTVGEADADLWKASVSGDREALGRLLRRHAGSAQAAIASRIGFAVDADDLLQETMRRAVERFRSVRDPERFGSWIYAIAQRVSWERLRAKGRERGRRRELEARHSPGGMEGSARAGAGEFRIEQALSQLDETDREALTLHHLEGMDYAGMSMLLGISEAGVSQRLSRARTRLREILKRQEAR